MSVSGVSRKIGDGNLMISSSLSVKARMRIAFNSTKPALKRDEPWSACVWSRPGPRSAAPCFAALGYAVPSTRSSQRGNNSSWKLTHPRQSFGLRDARSTGFTRRRRRSAEARNTAIRGVSMCRRGKSRVKHETREQTPVEEMINRGTSLREFIWMKSKGKVAQCRSAVELTSRRRLTQMLLRHTTATRACNVRAYCTKYLRTQSQWNVGRLGPGQHAFRTCQKHVAARVSIRPGSVTGPS